MTNPEALSVSGFFVSLPDILGPRVGMLLDEPGHELPAPLVMRHVHRDAPAPQMRLISHERAVLPDYHPRNTVQQNGAGAHGQGVHLPVQHGTPLLYPAVVATANDLAIVHQDRSDGNAALAEAEGRFIDGGLEEGVGHSAYGTGPRSGALGLAYQNHRWFTVLR